MSQRMFTESGVETALCVFEWLIDRQHAEDEPWADMFEDTGWGQMRLSAIQTAAWIEECLDGIDVGDCDVSFDWGIVPWFMGRLDPDKWIEGTAYGGREPFPDVTQTRAAFLLQFCKHHPVVQAVLEARANHSDERIAAALNELEESLGARADEP